MARRSRSAARSASARRSSCTAPSTSPSSGSKPASGLALRRWTASTIEKRVLLPHRQNTVHVTLPLVDGRRARCASSCARRSTSGRTKRRSASRSTEPYALTVVDERYEICRGSGAAAAAAARLTAQAAAFTIDGTACAEIALPRSRRAAATTRGDAVEPGLLPRRPRPTARRSTLVASTEPWETIRALDARRGAARPSCERRERLLAQAAPAAARAGTAAELVLAADQFIITPAGRVEDAARAHAAGDEVRTVIAGYHWFTDWGRDTMISLEGLTLATGRHDEAGYILRTFAHYVRDGLIPNMFPEGENEGLYHTADATLWFFHAARPLPRGHRRSRDAARCCSRAAATSSSTTCAARASASASIRPTACCARARRATSSRGWTRRSTTGWSRRGAARRSRSTRSGTTRCGCSQRWLREEEGDGPPSGARGDRRARAATSFNARFWYAEGGYLYDVVDGEPAATTRPAGRTRSSPSRSPIPVLDQQRWEPVLRDGARAAADAGRPALARARPSRLQAARTTAICAPRDAAYHQGTVWAWLIGPFVDAWLQRASRTTAPARAAPRGLRTATSARPASARSARSSTPSRRTRPRGCIAQAWSVAEVLRCWVKTSPQRAQG